MFLFSPERLFLYPGLLMTLVGLVVGGMLLSHPIYLSHARLGLDTLIYCSTLVLGGFQAMLLSVMSRTFATREGLYPQTVRFARFARHISLERGLLTGIVLTLVGFLTGGYAFLEWKNREFGDMMIEHIARIVIPSSLAISIGFELILFSLLLGTFTLGQVDSSGA